jgi:galactose oxidase
MPTPRSDPAAVATSDGRIFVIGGADNTATGLATVEIYTIASNSWASGPKLNYPRASLAAAITKDGHIYAIGGAGAVGSAVSLPIVEVYNP